jgi:lipoprotein-releasing system ATP-binding protein
MTDILELKNIYKSFDMGSHSVSVLEDFSINITQGASLALTGPSGVGKSTLLHIMGGLERPTAGDVLFKGEDIYTLPSKALDKYRNANVGFVFQFHYLLDDFTALENVMLPARLAGDSEHDAKKRAEALLSRMGLADRFEHTPKELSGGEQQRVALARALMNNPTILLADEPTGSLDKQNSLLVEELLFGLKDMGVALVLVTHDTELAARADKSIHMAKA